MRMLFAGQAIIALTILVGCDLDSPLTRSHLHEAEAVLLKLAVGQERFYIENRSYADDMKELGFQSDPFVTESGQYKIDLTSIVDIDDYSATATYVGADSEDSECQWLKITGSGARTSGPHDDCWRR